MAAKRPTEAQQAVLRFAVEEGYVRPGSPTHARKLDTTTGRLRRTCEALAGSAGWLRAAAGGKYMPTAATRELLGEQSPEEMGW